MELVWGSEAFLKRAHQYAENKAILSNKKEVVSSENEDLKEISEDIKELPQHNSELKQESLTINKEESRFKDEANKTDICSESNLKTVYIDQNTSVKVKIDDKNSPILPPQSSTSSSEQINEKNGISLETFNVNDMINEIRKEFDNEGSNHQPSNAKEEPDSELYKRIPPLL